MDWPLVSRYEQKLIAQHRRELEQRAGPGAVQEEKQRTAQAIRESDQFYNTAPYLQFVPYVTLPPAPTAALKAASVHVVIVRVPLEWFARHLTASKLPR